MNRLVVPQRSAAKARAVGESDADQAIGRLVKYIPGEVISGYMLFSGLVAGAAQTSPLRPFAGWLIFALGLAFTPLYLWKLGRPTGVQWWQLPISTLSFALWAYALGGPFLTVNIFGFAYESWFAALLAGLFSWGIALVWKPTD